MRRATQLVVTCRVRVFFFPAIRYLQNRKSQYHLMSGANWFSRTGLRSDKDLLVQRACVSRQKRLPISKYDLDVRWKQPTQFGVPKWLPVRWGSMKSAYITCTTVLIPIRRVSGDLSPEMSTRDVITSWIHNNYGTCRINIDPTD
jgi:hypothetical protein